MQATKKDHDSDAVVLMRAAGIIRKEIFQTQYRFKGSLLDEQYDNNPSSLIEMILGGTNIENQTEDVKRAALSITQLLVFNAMKRAGKIVRLYDITLIEKQDSHSTWGLSSTIKQGNMT